MRYPDPGGVARERPGTRPHRLGTEAHLAGLLAARGEAWVTGEGNSMWPTIRDGDRVLLRPVHALRPGMVVLVRIGRRFVLHRVLRALPGGGIVTIGDANRTAETSPDLSCLIGHAVVAVRRERRTPVALEPTLEYGLAALGRGIVYRLRLSLARRWRTSRGAAASPIALDDHD